VSNLENTAPQSGATPSATPAPKQQINGQDHSAKIVKLDGRPAIALPQQAGSAKAPPSRTEFLIGSWLKRQLPPRDYLLGDVISTTSRWLIFGDTGIGKTLFALAMAGAIAAGKPFLNWKGRRKARVVYLDGELSAETFKERMELIAEIYGADIQLYGYNREVLGEGGMPPLNGEAGQKWLKDEIALIKPDIIFFDSVMSLLIGTMSEEESWAPMKAIVREITAKRIAQVWLHHTGHDGNRSFGTKTREWEMDTVLGMLKEGEEETENTAARIEFRKARLRNPDTFEQFMPRVVRFVDGEWQDEGEASKRGKKGDGIIETIRAAILDAYGRLADNGERSTGFDGKPIIRVKVDLIRDDVKRRGHLDTDDKGHIVEKSRQNFSRAKSGLIKPGGKLIEVDGLIWSP
jgi:hypothetical protein